MAGTCTDANETVVVNKATPTISTQVSASTITLGSSVTDLATVTGVAGVPTPTGAVTFKVYGPGDDTCAGAGVTVTGGNLVSGSVTSGSFTPTQVGTYHWIATYAGDANYAGVAGTCTDANETVVVNKATPTISTQVSASSIVLGSSVTDTATVTGVAGGPTPTGAVTFKVYLPIDPTCSGPGATVTGGNLVAGSVTSAAFTPGTVTPPGTAYHWIATYAGDANYAGVAGTCTDANEAVVVTRATPTISTQVSASTITLGSSVTDTATVTAVPGVPTPLGAVTFKVYGPGDDTCTGAGVTVAGGNLSSGSVTSAAFTPTQVGTYHWIATYAGDANNAGVAGTCSDANETVVVNQATPKLLTAATTPAALPAGTIHDVATVSGPTNAPAPTGTVTFTLYGPLAAAPTSTSCTDGNRINLGPSFTVPLTPTGATSPDYTPTAAGNYAWIASYSGDTNYAAIEGTCGDGGETSEVFTPHFLTWKTSVPVSGSTVNAG